MAAPEWYSGTDSSGQVAAGIESVIERMDANVADQSDMDKIGSLHSLEQDFNWRAFLLGLLGTIHYDLEQEDQAMAILQESLAGYRPYLETFDEVISVYCQSCYTLGTLYYNAEKFAEAIPCFMRCLPYMNEVYDGLHIANIFFHLNICLSIMDEDQMSLVFSEAAVFARRCDCETLENLMISYQRAGDLDKASEVFELLSASCQDYEHFDRVLDFAKRTLGESGTVN